MSSPPPTTKPPSPAARVPPPPPPRPPAAAPGGAAAPPPPPPPAPVPQRTRDLADRLTQRFQGLKVDYMRARRLKVTTDPATIKDVAFFARDELGFDHIGTVAGTDYIKVNEMEVVYFVGAPTKPDLEDFIIEIAERTKREDPLVPSLVDVWQGAEYHERDTFEMLGIKFTGHPDLRRLLLPEDWDDIPPLRKDYTNPGH